MLRSSPGLLDGLDSGSATTRRMIRRRSSGKLPRSASEPPGRPVLEPGSCSPGDMCGWRAVVRRHSPASTSTPPAAPCLNDGGGQGRCISRSTARRYRGQVIGDRRRAPRGQPASAAAHPRGGLQGGMRVACRNPGDPRRAPCSSPVGMFDTAPAVTPAPPTRERFRRTARSGGARCSPATRDMRPNGRANGANRAARPSRR